MLFTGVSGSSSLYAIRVPFDVVKKRSGADASRSAMSLMIQGFWGEVMMSRLTHRWKIFTNNSKTFFQKRVSSSETETIRSNRGPKRKRNPLGADSLSFSAGSP